MKKGKVCATEHIEDDIVTYKPPITIGENAQTRRLFLMFARPEMRSLKEVNADRIGLLLLLFLFLHYYLSTLY